MKFINLILISIFLMIGCAPVKITPTPQVKAEFKKTPKYKLDLKGIPTPPKIEFIFMNNKFKRVKNKNNAYYMTLIKKEYAKIPAYLKTINAIIKISKEQEKIINTHIGTINYLKEYIDLEQNKTNNYKILWTESENLYRHEKYLHKMDNTYNRITSGIIIISSFVAIVAL